MQDNGFYEKYQSRGRYRDTIVENAKRKDERETFFGLYQRPTIGFKLQCESDGISRSEAYRILGQKLSFENASEYEITENDLMGFKFLYFYIGILAVQNYLIVWAFRSIQDDASIGLGLLLGSLVLQIIPWIFIGLGLYTAID